ncbi:ankyrin repeat-containing domain protein [Xylariales sp. AK1849]|nr:ankyrin repeat-containing domain protein [Xylariales sp. AK1849]
MEKVKDDLGEELYQACIQNRRDTAEKLINERIDQAEGAKTMMPSVFYAAVTGDATDVVGLCLEQKVPVTDRVMVAVVCSSSFASYQAIIEAKAIDIDYFIPWYGDILGNAAKNNNLDWAKFCLEHGANPNCNLIDEYKSVLAVTAEEDHLAMAELLIQHGAWVKGSGAIVLAADAGHTDMVQLLLAKDADVNEVGLEDPQDPETSSETGSALHKAIANGHIDTALFLIREGADKDLKDGRGQTARDLAAQSQQIVLLQELDRNK